MKKILIVDDQVEVRELVDVTLRVSDYKILQAESGEKAIEITKAELPDLIIMDIMMPGGINGFETTKAIKSDPETKACTVVILSAEGEEVDKQRAQQAGADGYFVKPFSPLELLNKVEEVLE